MIVCAATGPQTQSIANVVTTPGSPIEDVREDITQPPSPKGSVSEGRRPRSCGPAAARACAAAILPLDAGSLRQIDMTVVLETQREVIRAEFQLNELEGGAAFSLIELEYAAGGRLGRIETLTSHKPDTPASSSTTMALVEEGSS